MGFCRCERTTRVTADAVAQVESALAALDETDGRIVNGEIADAIFARFCVGK